MWSKKCWLWTMTHLATCFKHCSTRMKALMNPLNESLIHFKSSANPKPLVYMVNERLASDKLLKHPTKRPLTTRLYKLSWTMFRLTRYSNLWRIDFSKDETLEMQVFSQTQCPSKYSWPATCNLPEASKTWLSSWKPRCRWLICTSIEEPPLIRAGPVLCEKATACQSYLISIWTGVWSEKTDTLLFKFSSLMLRWCLIRQSTSIRAKRSKNSISRTWLWKS